MGNKELLEGLGIDLKRIRENGKTTCPKCSHERKKKTDPCLSVNVTEGIYKCHNCSWSGGVGKKESYVKKDYLKPVFNNNTKLPDSIVKFFEGRMINQKTISDFKITTSRQFFPQLNEEGGSIDFNYFRDNDLINIKHRGNKKSFKMFKGAELIFYNIDSIKESEVVIITEGEIDAMAVHQSGHLNVISVPNGATMSDNPNLEYLDNCIDSLSLKSRFILATDNDEPGRKLRKELSRRLGSHKCYTVDFGDCKDANDYLKFHGEKALYDVISNHKEMPIEGVILVDDVWDELEDFFQNGLERGATTSIMKDFDKHVSFVPGHSMSITGVPNHGKSLLANMIMCSLSVFHGWKWAIYSPEHKPLSIFLAKISEILLGKRVRKGVGFTQMERDAVKNFMKEHFFFIEPENGEANLESILSKAESLVFRKGIRGFILDPWNKIDHEMSKGDSETQYISKALDKIIYFGQRNSVFNIIVAHPTKIRKKTNGLYEVPSQYDIAGSAHFFNKMDWGITFYRNFETGKNEIYIQKSKWEHLGSVGSIECDYNVNNGRLKDISSQWDNSNWLIKSHEQTDIFNSIPEDIDSEPAPF